MRGPVTAESEHIEATVKSPLPIIIGGKAQW